MAQAVVVIPARYASKRLPGKPLLAETGRPLIAHVIERASAARTVERVVVATDDERIRDAAEAAGAVARMTSPDHACGTDRVAEAVAGLAGPELVVNLQGDEPEIEPGDIDRLVEDLERSPAPMATLAAPLAGKDAFEDRSVVKVVVDAGGHALYFSRAPIPWDRDGEGRGPRLRHIGIYGFRREALSRFAGWPPSKLERTERLEQLRALENGMRIRVTVVDRAPPGIDTVESYRAFAARWAGRPGS